jgi:hypothetical protein
VDAGEELTGCEREEGALGFTEAGGELPGFSLGSFVSEGTVGVGRIAGVVVDKGLGGDGVSEVSVILGKAHNLVKGFLGSLGSGQVVHVGVGIGIGGGISRSGRDQGGGRVHGGT